VQHGPFGPVPPTGKVATYTDVHFFTVDEGRITDPWAKNDTFNKVFQLGAELVPLEAPDESES